jgi:uncharacterized protein
MDGSFGGRDDWLARRRQMEASGYRHGPRGRRGRWRQKPFHHALRLLDRGLKGTKLYARGRQNALDLRLVELELAFADLPPAFDGYRILQVTDTHFDALPELADAARQLMAGIEVDMLALTGDVQGEHGAPPPPHSVELLGHALADVRVHHERVAVLGNHDAADMVGLLGRLGFDVLVNRSKMLELAGERLHLIGLDDVHYFYTDAARAALDNHQGGFRIALVHSPELADDAAAAGYALYLCGHTHGGQICLPGGRPVFTQLTRCRFAAKGLWRRGNMTGYTSSGLGVSGLPLRFNNRGEVVLITLRRGA